MAEKTTLYRQIGEELARKIMEGYFLPGEKMWSRAQLCDRYDISAVTAVRVQNFLADLGLVRKVHGSGLFVNYDAKALPSPLGMPECEQPIRRIIEYRQSGTNDFAQSIFSGAEREAAARSLAYRVDMYNRVEVSLRDLNTQPIDPEAGYLVLAVGPASLFHAGIVLMNPNIRSVVIDTLIAGSHCVLTDCLDGMRQLIEFAVARGCRRLIFAEHFANLPGELYSAERREGARMVARLWNLECRVASSGNFHELLELVRQPGPRTAVLFPQDAPALRFMRHLEVENIPNVLTLGFDDYVEDGASPAGLTTIRVDCDRLGATAVELLMKNDRQLRIERVPGQLIVRSE